MADDALLPVLRRAAQKRRGRVAVVHGDVRITYDDLLARVEHAARELRAHGVGTGARVAVLLDGAHYLEAFFAVTAVGAVIAPVDPRLTPDAASTIVHRVEPNLVLAPHGLDAGDATVVTVPADDDGVPLHEHLRALPDQLPPAPPDHAPGAAAIFHTAGTSGLPLGIVHSQAGLLRATYAVEQTMRSAFAPTLQRELLARRIRTLRRLRRRLMGAARNPVVLLPMALQNISGHTSIMGAIASGARLVLSDGFHPHRTFELIERERVTNLGGTPMMLELLTRVKREFDTSSLLLVMSGGELVAPAILREIHDRFGCAVGAGYGATELAGPALLTRLDDTIDVQTETVGRALPGVDATIGAGGELRVRVPHPMLGYWRDRDRTATALDADGWYRTGDLATIDNDGVARILGRVTDVVTRADRTLAAGEIERALERLVGAREVAVVDAPDRTGRATLCAFVVPDPPTQPLDVAAVTASAQQVLPEGWTLDRVEQLPRLPRTTDGKVRKQALREQVTAAPEA